MSQQTSRQTSCDYTAALDKQFKVMLQNIRYISELMKVVWIVLRTNKTVLKRSDTYRGKKKKKEKKIDVGYTCFYSEHNLVRMCKRFDEQVHKFLDAPTP